MDTCHCIFGQGYGYARHRSIYRRTDWLRMMLARSYVASLPIDRCSGIYSREPDIVRSRSSLSSQVSARTEEPKENPGRGVGGRTEEVWQARRTLDHLESRPGAITWCRPGKSWAIVCNIDYSFAESRRETAYVDCRG